MREHGRYQLQLMKTRSSSGVGQKIDLDFNIDSLRITDIDEEDIYNPSSQSTGSALLNSIKQRSLLDDGAPVAKVQAEVQSSKLRLLLNNLPE